LSERARRQHGWQSHGTKTAFHSDRSCDRILRFHGYSVTHITWNQLEDEAEALAADLRTLLSPSPKKNNRNRLPGAAPRERGMERPAAEAGEWMQLAGGLQTSVITYNRWPPL